MNHDKAPRIITIVVRSRGGFAVHEGEAFHDGLCFGEMLEQVIGLTHPQVKHPPYPMMTAEEHAEWQADRERIRMIRKWREGGEQEVNWP
jgi:hypothetical protein